MNVNRYIGKCIYDYFDNNGRRYDFDRVVEFFNIFDDFKMFNKDYINCIVIKLLIDVNNIIEVNDLFDEDLFMFKEEYGVFS